MIGRNIFYILRTLASKLRVRLACANFCVDSEPLPPAARAATTPPLTSEDFKDFEVFVACTLSLHEHGFAAPSWEDLSDGVGPEQSPAGADPTQPVCAWQRFAVECHDAFSFEGTVAHAPEDPNVDRSDLVHLSAFPQTTRPRSVLSHSAGSLTSLVPMWPSTRPWPRSVGLRCRRDLASRGGTLWRTWLRRFAHKVVFGSAPMCSSHTLT